VDEYGMKDGRKIYLLGEERLINLTAAERASGFSDGHELCQQALACEYLVKNHKSLERKVYPVLEELDKRIARLKLESMGYQD
jgi:adenosylhomocysteinase